MRRPPVARPPPPLMALMALMALEAAAAAVPGGGAGGCAAARVFDVGAGRELARIRDVPLADLRPGDHIRVHWQPEPYREKWVVPKGGTPACPVTFSGVPSADGRYPVIDGASAVSPAYLDYWGGARSVIKVGGAVVPNVTYPANVVIEGLVVQGANESTWYWEQQAGKWQAYNGAAGCIRVESGANVTVRNNTLRWCANGLLSSVELDGRLTRNLSVERNFIYGNGVVNSLYQHNVYTAAVGTVFAGNHIGPLREGSPGNALKDRSAGLVVTANWIEGGGRQLDLVDDDTGAIYGLPEYGTTVVSGNVLINRGYGNDQWVHYGGDSGNLTRYRNGTLQLYHNTLVSYRNDTTTLVELATNDCAVYAQNNVVYAAHTGVNVLYALGRATVVTNVVAPNHTDCEARASDCNGTVTYYNNSELRSPGFLALDAEDLRLAQGSAGAGFAAPLPPDLPPVRLEYVRPRGLRPRASAADAGAFAYDAGARRWPPPAGPLPPPPPPKCAPDVGACALAWPPYRHFLVSDYSPLPDPLWAPCVEQCCKDKRCTGWEFQFANESKERAPTCWLMDYAGPVKQPLKPQKWSYCDVPRKRQPYPPPPPAPPAPPPVPPMPVPPGPQPPCAFDVDACNIEWPPWQQPAASTAAGCERACCAAWAAPCTAFVFVAANATPAGAARCLLLQDPSPQASAPPPGGGYSCGVKRK